MNMVKTPVMILQELGVKEGFLPAYTLSYSQTGKNLNVFTYEVKYKEQVAMGQAFNKKEAKQNAAHNMLILINEIKAKSIPIISAVLPLKKDINPSTSITTALANSSWPSQSSSSSSSSSSLPPEDLTNYVGSLQEFCIVNKLVQPEYELSFATGLAHEKTFTMSCKVGAISEEGKGSTKKQAKQHVAKNMLQRLHGSNAIIIPNKSQCKTEINSSATKVSSSATKISSLATKICSSATKIRSSAIEISSSATEICSSKTEFCSSKTEICSSKTEICSSKTKISSCKTEVSSLKTEVSSSKMEVSSSKTEVSSSKTEVSSSKTEISMSKTKINERSATRVDTGKEHDRDVFEELGLRIVNLNLVNILPQKEVETKYLELTSKSCSPTLLPDENLNFQNYHLFFKSFIYQNVCEGKEEELILIYNHIKKFKSILSKIDYKRDKKDIFPIEERILNYIRDTLKLNIEKKAIRCKNPLLKMVAFKISTPLPIIQFGANNSILIAEVIALRNILDTVMIYLK